MNIFWILFSIQANIWYILCVIRIHTYVSYSMNCYVDCGAHTSLTFFCQNQSFRRSWSFYFENISPVHSFMSVLTMFNHHHLSPGHDMGPLPNVPDSGHFFHLSSCILKTYLSIPVCFNSNLFWTYVLLFLFGEYLDVDFVSHRLNKRIFSFIRNCQTTFQTDCNILTSKVWVIQFLNILTRIWCCHFILAILTNVVQWAFP